MGKQILPDSNVYIDALRAGVDPFQYFAQFFDQWDFVTCGMVMFEVCRGVRDPHQLQRIRDRFGVMIFLPTPNPIWERATQLAWALDRQGRVIPAQDILIAATALQAGAAVLTRDAHFQHVPGLEVIRKLS